MYTSIWNTYCILGHKLGSYAESNSMKENYGVTPAQLNFICQKLGKGTKEYLGPNFSPRN